MSEVDPSKIEKVGFSRRRGERSFSLLETIIAVSLIATLMVEVSGVYGNAISFNQYGRKILQASYLAKRVMAQVEYQAAVRSPLKDIKISEKDKVFEDAPDFSYSLTIEPMPGALDLMFKIMSGGLLGGEEGEKSEGGKDGAGALLGQIKPMITQAVGDEPIWVAKVEVSWTEGAKKNSTEIAMIIADTKKLEDSVGTLMDAAQVTPPTGGPPAGSQPGAVPPPSPNPANPATSGGGR